MTTGVFASGLTSIALLVLTRCDGSAEPPDTPWWNDGSGGAQAVPLLESLDIEELSCGPERVEAMSCRFLDDGIMINVTYSPGQPVAEPYLMTVQFSGFIRGSGLTPTAGSVRLMPGCFGAVSTTGAPEPCELELQGIQRGEPEERSTGSGGATSVVVEVGSRVRVRVSCPDGLYYPGTDDVNPFVRHIIPNEFALEAQDCVVVE